MAVDMFIKIDGIKGESADDKHKEVAGYSYTNTACVSCHPTGR